MSGRGGQPMATGVFIPARGSLEDSLGLVEYADELGYDAVYVGQMAGREALTMLTACAARTRTVRLASGVVPIYARSPVAMAQAAATLDELSGGRMALGLGVSQPAVVDAWYRESVERPVRDMREYVSALRAILRGEDAPTAERFSTHFRFLGYEPRRDIPIYIAALSPAMLRLAGELGDGVIVRLCHPDYIREVVIPALRDGRERAGKTLEGFDVVASVPAAVTDAPADALAKLRHDIALFFRFPSYRKVFERGGFGDEVLAFDAAIADGGPDAGAAAISDRFLGGLAAVGSEEEAAATVHAYREAGVTSPSLRPVSDTDAHATLSALARAGRRLSTMAARAAASITSTLLLTAMALGAVSSAQAAEQITAAFPYRFDPNSEEMDQGERLTFLNADTNPFDSEHDVTAADSGPDGKPLFQTPIIAPGTEVFIEGSQYLSAGTYSFFCSVHSIGMRGTLTVTTAGAPVPPPGTAPPPAQPRDTTPPQLAVGIVSSRVATVRRRGRLTVEAQVSEAALVTLRANATIGGRTFTLGDGAFRFAGPGRRRIAVEITSRARRALRRAEENGRSALVTVRGKAKDEAANVGTGTAKRRLRA